MKSQHHGEVELQKEQGLQHIQTVGLHSSPMIFSVWSLGQSVL
jgi:hypothetical protein